MKKKTIGNVLVEVLSVIVLCHDTTYSDTNYSIFECDKDGNGVLWCMLIFLGLLQ